MKKFSNIVGRSVFKPLPKDQEMNSLLTVAFHRSAATLYMLYFLWGVASTVKGAPSLVQTNGQTWTTIFAVLIILTTAPACFGATFWPNYARLELFAGSSVSVLLAIYVVVLGYNAILGNNTWASVFLTLSILVIPTVRTVVVYLFLIRQAELNPNDVAQGV
jgi:undecaprenyl pyrophosphate phosphatase UppP